MSDIQLLRIGILVAMVILLGGIMYFGRPRKEPQGRRRGEAANGSRVEPTLDGEPSWAPPVEEGEQAEMALGQPAVAPPESELGKRPDPAYEKLVTLYVAARAGQSLAGQDILVAAEKAGLTFGHASVFHRLVDGHPERGPVFSVANVLQPGSFDLDSLAELRTPAIAFFLALPAPVDALDAWEMMQPAAQRMAELLDGVLLDESKNALGRQRIQHIREEMRAWDREHEAPPVRPSRW